MASFTAAIVHSQGFSSPLIISIKLVPLFLSYKDISNSAVGKKHAIAFLMYSQYKKYPVKFMVKKATVAARYSL